MVERRISAAFYPQVAAILQHDGNVGRGLQTATMEPHPKTGRISRRFILTRVFLAENVSPVPHTPDPNEIAGIELLNLSRAVEMAIRGELKTSSTTMGVLLLHQRLGT